MADEAMQRSSVIRQEISDADLVRIGARPGMLEYLRQLWHFRRFIWYDSRARVSASNYDDSLGLAWIIINPILNGLTYYLIFGVLLGTGRGVPNFIAYLIVGVFVFRFTSASIMSGSRAITSGKSLLRAFNFPRATLPIASNVRELLQTVPTYIVMAILVLLIPPLEPITIWWLVLIPLTVLQFTFNVGVSLILSRLVAHRNDYTHLISFALRIWMYLSAVFFSISRFEGNATIYLIMQLNPAYAFLDIAREGLLYGGPAGWLSWTVASVSAIGVATAGLFYFWFGEEAYGEE